MRELLALPAWKSPPVPLEAWAERLSARVLNDGGEVWLEVPARRLRGYVVLEEGHVSAVNFELSGPEDDGSEEFLQEAAAALGWELHEDTEEDDDEE
jgi:hypothetical protein